ncbi:MAG: cation-transporting P-type ATPase [Armatimonadia bacterium]
MLAILPAQPWARDWQDVAAELNTSAELGLSHDEVLSRRDRYGTNCLAQAKPKSAWGILLHQFRSLIIALLAVAALVSFFSHAVAEGVAVLIVIVINTAIGFFTEIRAVRSMEALRDLGTVPATVRRHGQLQQITAEEVVPGDILVLEAGQVLSADARIVSASRLQADESTLTGESDPVAKHEPPVAAGTPLAERTSMLYRGTALNRGSGEAVVTAVGLATELGQVSEMIAEAEQDATPLEKRLDALGQRLVWITLVIAAAIIALGLMQGRAVLLMIETGIALAVATIPEGLPIVATAALARGMWRMARRNALISRLSAVETLGATSVVCTDKTGTLTENRMTVRRVVTAEGDYSVTGGAFETDGSFVRDGVAVEAAGDPLLRRTLMLGALCNTAGLHDGPQGRVSGAVGDPLEVALLVAAARAELEKPHLLEHYPLVRQEPFDPDLKMMATYHGDGRRVLVAVKGAPERVLSRCEHVLTAEGEVPLDDDARRLWMSRNEELGREGLRMVAAAQKYVDDPEEPPYEGLALVALIGLQDPPRQEVTEALRLARMAGVRVIMMTGDQATTAQQVAKAVGLVQEHDNAPITGTDLPPAEEWSAEDKGRLLGTSIFARVSPRQKLDLIELHQQRDSIVAMTGDGVNDAPALEKADIGVAMGLRGTQVAKEAADMILLDDSFNTIIYAIEQGRVIFRNIRRFVLYLLSCNVAEIMTVTLASVVDAPLPILPLQILFLNLVTDVFPALALGVGEGEPGIMRRPPRDPHEPILATRHWIDIVIFGFTITVGVLGALGLSMFWLHLPEHEAITVSFLTLAVAQLWHVFNLRDPNSNWWRNDIVGNKYIWGAIALCGGLLVTALKLPVLANVLDLVNPGAMGLLVALGMSLLPLVVGQLVILPLKRWRLSSPQAEKPQQRSATSVTP